MTAITKEYLVDIIYRVVNKSISIHRQSKSKSKDDDAVCVTDEELLDFIHSTPYFDEGLKNFLVGNLTDATIIISQSWETEYYKKTMAWAESYEWLHGNEYFLSEAHISSIKKNLAFLSLPY